MLLGTEKPPFGMLSFKLNDLAKGLLKKQGFERDPMRPKERSCQEPQWPFRDFRATDMLAICRHRSFLLLPLSDASAFSVFTAVGLHFCEILRGRWDKIRVTGLSQQRPG